MPLVWPRELHFIETGRLLFVRWPFHDWRCRRFIAICVMWALGQFVPRSLGVRSSVLKQKRRRPSGSELRSQSENKQERRKDVFDIAIHREQRWQDIRLLKRQER